MPTSTPPKILVIDDEVAVLGLLRTLLGRLGYEITTAESASEALSLLGRGTYDCVITDAMMPEMSGYELVKALRADARYIDLPVLMLTRKRHREDVKQAVEAGVTDYVLKPIDERLLLEKIELCIKRSEKKPAQESPVTGPASEAEIGVACRIASVGESSLTLRLQYRVESHVPFRLRTRIFSDIGIIQPALRLQSCEMSAAEGTHPDYAWIARFSFGPLPEADELRLREWLHRQVLPPKTIQDS